MDHGWYKLLCLKGNGENWCNGDCVWKDGRCLSGGAPYLNSQQLGFHLISYYCLNLFQGSWSPWSPWSSCSQSCGEGIATRTRSCSSSSPASCPGSSTDTRRCMGRNCSGCIILSLSRPDNNFSNFSGWLVVFLDILEQLQSVLWWRNSHQSTLLLGSQDWWEAVLGTGPRKSRLWN